jgi:hypothetical protein
VGIKLQQIFKRGIEMFNFKMRRLILLKV